jgi:hypothetical protein
MVGHGDHRYHDVPIGQLHRQIRVQQVPLYRDAGGPAPGDDHHELGRIELARWEVLRPWHQDAGHRAQPVPRGAHQVDQRGQ